MFERQQEKLEQKLTDGRARRAQAVVLKDSQQSAISQMRDSGGADIDVLLSTKSLKSYRLKLHVRVEPDSEPAFEQTFTAHVAGPLLGDGFKRGNQVPVIYDPSDHSVGWDQAGWRDMQEEMERRSRAYAAQASAAQPLSESLAELADLHAQGSLSDAEFTAAKRKLIDGE